MSVEEFAECIPTAVRRVEDCMLPLSEGVCAQLLKEHGAMVKAACQRIVGDPCLAEDIAQETFLLLIRRLPSLAPQTILAGWLYVTACNLARTHWRAQTRRQHRENQPEALDHLMNPTEERVWRELETFLDTAMQTLSERQRELVLARYFQNQTQRAAAALLGCSESVASRELSAALERLRKFFSRHGVTISGAVLGTVLSEKAAQASMPAVTLAGTLSSASALAASSAVGGGLLFALMKTTTTAKIMVAACALLIAIGTVQFLTRKDESSRNKQRSTLAAADQTRPESGPPPAGALISKPLSPSISGNSTANQAKALPAYSEAALKLAHQTQEKFWERIDQLYFVDDAAKVQQLLADEYGIRFSIEDIRNLKRRNPKSFKTGVVDLWAARQPQEALAWAASTFSDPATGSDWSVSRMLLQAARRSLPNLNRDMLEGMLPEGPGKAGMLDLIEARTDPASLANRLLTTTDANERSFRLKALAQEWQNPEAAANWARQNLSGDERISFYSVVAYSLGDYPQAALQVLSELQGTDAFASAFAAMMQGLVQYGGLGQQAAELIDKATLDPKDRADLIAELARRWMRQNPDATIAWANGLTSPQDFRAAIPHVVSQLDNDRVARTIETYLKNPDPTMEAALIEAAAPKDVYFDPEKSRLILDALTHHDPNVKIQAPAAADTSDGPSLWNSIKSTTRREIEEGSPVVAMEWLSKLRFATPKDYSEALANGLALWNLKSPTEAANWVQSSSLDSTLKSELLKTGKP